MTFFETGSMNCAFGHRTQGDAARTAFQRGVDIG